MDSGITENDIQTEKRLSNYHKIFDQEGKAPDDQLKVMSNDYRPIYDEETLRARMGLSKRIKFI